MNVTLRVMGAAVAGVWLSAVAVAQFPSELVGFNDAPIDDPAASQEMFQIPQYSGTTSEFIELNATGAYNSNSAFRAAGLQTEGDAALQVTFQWLDPADPDAWLRLTTFSGVNYPNPGLHTQGKVRFTLRNRGDIFTFTGEFGLALGIRETGTTVQQLGNGGSVGPIEWVGVDPTVNGITAGADLIVDTAAAGDDVQELAVGTNLADLGLPAGTAVVSPGANGVIDTAPANDDEERVGYTIGANGARVPVPAITLPTDPDAYELEWNLVTGDVRVTHPFYYPGGQTFDGAVAGFTGNGVLDATDDRGVLEHLALTNVLSDLGTKIEFAIDELQVEAPVPDPTPAPLVRAPVFDTDTVVEVETIAAATQAELFLNDVSVGTAAPVNQVATFGGLSLGAGDILTATQTANGLVSPKSPPVVVFEPGVIVADNFDAYATQADLNVFWKDSIASPAPPTAKLLLQPGSAASCPNYLREENPAGANAARLYRDIGGVTGTDAEPVVVTWNFRWTGTQGSAGIRTRFELAHFNGGAFSTGARAEGSCGITLFNQVGGDLFNEYNLVLRVTDNTALFDELVGNGWVDSAGFLRYPSGVAKQADVWHKMQIEVKESVLNFYIDDVLVNPAPYQAGIPRPNTTEYDFIILGEGYSNNGPQMMFDNISVTQGTAHPFGPPVPSAPTIVAPAYPGISVVNLADVDPAASEVVVYADGVEIGSATGPFGDGTASVPVAPALVNGAALAATQTIDGVESCGSMPVTVSVPAVRIADALLVPSQTTVQVADLAEGLASQLTIYSGETTPIGSLASPATDPATVTTSPLSFGATIYATQTINGIQGPLSAGVAVTVPAPVINTTLVPGETSVPVEGVHPLAGAVTVYVNGAVAGSAPGGGSTTVDVPISSSLFVNDQVWATQTIGGVESPDSNTVNVEVPLCFLVYSDDFETNTAAAWHVNIFDNGGQADAAATFAFDYSAAGIPPSPNGGGTTRGLKFEANQGGTAAVAAVTVSPRNQSFSAAAGYRLTFDMWINANGPFPAGGAGSTEFLNAGVGYDNTTVNLGGVSGHGGWFTISGEGGSTYDVRAYKDIEHQFPESGQYAAGNTSGVADNTNNDPFYADLFGTPSPPAEQAAIWPNQTGSLLPGSAGFAWHEVTITVYGTKARWEINGVPIVTLDTTIGNPFSGLDGNVCLGYMDLFTSLSDNPAMSFGLVDNVKIFVSGTVGTAGDFNNDGRIDAVDFAAFEDCLGGPDVPPDPAAGSGCANACRTAFDFDQDTDADLADFAELQVGFTGP